MNLARLPTLLRTLRYLRPSQAGWRVRYLLERRLPPAKPAPLPKELGEPDWGSAIRADFPEIPLFHRPGPGGAEAVANLSQGRFVHLNRGVLIGRTRPDWQLSAQNANRLWITTLHHQAWAYDLAEAAQAPEESGRLAETLFQEYLSDWIARCGLEAEGSRDLAWNAYALATRLSWWIRAGRLLGAERFAGRPEFSARFLTSAWQQAAYLHDHLEWDLRGNHVLRDAVGLAWAGRFFQGPAAGKWLETAAGVADDQVLEQVLPDGGHFERSPMYHIHAMEDVLTLALLLDDREVADRLKERWAAMAEYLAWMRHPDGMIPLFNDGARRAVCEPARMLGMGGLLGRTVAAAARSGGRHFAETGLVAWQGRPWTVFFDVGPIGPDDQPGHGHADTLSFECSFAGERLVVDPGTHSYDQDERRQYDRSTGAHNTVCLDHENSSEVWHIFRVGRRARPVGVKVEGTKQRLMARAGHDGYDHLPGRPRAARTITVDDSGALSLTDRIEGRGRHLVEGGLLLAPEWKAAATAGGWELSSGSRRVRVSVTGPKEMRGFAERRRFHPEYGLELETTRLSWSVESSLPVQVQTVFEGS